MELSLDGAEGGGDGSIGVGRGRLRTNGHHDLGDDGRGGEDVDVVGVGKDGATGAKEGLDADNERVEAEGEELRPKRAALACATARGDDSRVGAGSADVKACGGAVHGGDPGVEIRPEAGNLGQELAAVNGVERVAEIQRAINPIGVGLEGGSDGMGEEIEAGGAGDAHLGRPGGAIRLARVWGPCGTGTRRWGLEVGGEAVAVLPRGDHGDDSAEDRADGDGAELPVGDDSTVWLVAVLPESYEAAPEEPGAD